jgi:hypothetical protein
MVPVHGLRGLEPDSIGIYELVPDDGVLAQAGGEGMKTLGHSGYNPEPPAGKHFARAVPPRSRFEAPQHL